MFKQKSSTIIIITIIIIIIIISATGAQNVSRVYPNGKGFPTESLSYVKMKFKQINHNISWDMQNYLETMSANLSSCNYPGGMVDGYAKIPTNQSWVAFIEFENSSATAKKDVVSVLNPVVDKWIAKKRYNVQIIGAVKFGCTVNPGCGYREARMAISCVFSPSSPMYVPAPDEYDEVKPVLELREAPKGSEPIQLKQDQYLNGQIITGKRWERSHFLENLSRLETNCEMLTSDDWQFNKYRPVVYGLDEQINGIFGRNTLTDDVDLTIDVILPSFKDKLPPNIQIGCTYIPDCSQRDVKWVVLACLYEERCRKQLCF